MELALISFDGLDPRVLYRNEDRLPNFSEFMESSMHGKWNTPGHTIPSFISTLTGKNYPVVNFHWDEGRGDFQRHRQTEMEFMWDVCESSMTLLNMPVLYPPEEIDTESITFKFGGRKPGQFSSGPLGKGTVREHTSHIRSSVKHPNNPSQRLLTYGKFYEDMVFFYTYARSFETSLKRALWFEKVMSSFIWVFRTHGFIVQLDTIGETEEESIGELRLFKHPITYLIRTNETYNLTSQELREVIIKFNVS